MAGGIGETADVVVALVAAAVLVGVADERVVWVVIAPVLVAAMDVATPPGGVVVVAGTVVVVVVAWLPVTDPAGVWLAGAWVAVLSPQAASSTISSTISRSRGARPSRASAESSPSLALVPFCNACWGSGAFETVAGHAR